MWPPPNVQFLPLKEEIQIVKDEISTIEMEIAETELRLDALRKSLFERKVWIAPIRKIPPEILSLAFIEASKNDWKAPLVLQSVSRRWRDVVLETPIAWTLMPLSEYSSKPRSDLISLFLERSRNTPLHIYVGNNSLLRYMKRVDDRIECIHLKTASPLLIRYLQHGHEFHRLERLKIDTWDWDAVESPPTDDPAALDMSPFPNLKVLDIKSRSFSLLSAISAVPEFPAIRHLTIDYGGPWRLSDILIKCAMSLESLDLTYDTGHFEALDMGQEIHFPRLRYLKLLDWSYEESRLRFKAATPNLQAHLDGGDLSTFDTVKVDTSSVVLLHVRCTPDLSRYPRLVTLCFSGESCDEGEVIKATECLRDSPTLCPDLALIEYLGEMKKKQLVEAEDALLARGRVTGQKIQLMEGTVERRNERAQTFKNLEPCGTHMPCKMIVYK